jgi:choline dehydrogenase-like flavoprotein
MSNNKYDVIVIGAGMSGSWAAKEFCEKGFKVLLLERGRDVKHLKDYPTTSMHPWEFPNKMQLSHDLVKDNPVVSKCYAFREDTTHFFVKDKEHEYIQDKPFDWIRGYQVGGKSIMWARQTQRWSDYDFEGPKRDGFAIDWPIRYKDIAPWYSHVEKFVGISGDRDGLDTLPDSEVLPSHELNCLEKHFQGVVKKNYNDRHVIVGRCAHLSKPEPIHIEQGRVQCQSRMICERGCPYGGYFNANAVTIPWAQKTGNLTLRPHSVVHSIIYDEAATKATGVKVIDEKTKEEFTFNADTIFVNAGCLNTNLILLNSKSKRFANGLGNDNGLLGKYLGFHNYRCTVNATCEDFQDVASEGRKPSNGYMPRFKNIKENTEKFKRGYAVGLYMGRGIYPNSNGIGEELVNNLMKPNQYGPWSATALMMGETIPREENKVTLDAIKKDAWGIPQLRIDIDYDNNDVLMMEDFKQEFTKMFEQAGYKNIVFNDDKRAPGLDIHEMGGARMGKDPKTSILNEWNQIHSCKNVYVTDGACMTSMGTQNPSLTFMAITARAANHAIEELKKNKQVG